jgi:NAD(P)H-nitrite reductase large subunit
MQETEELPDGVIKQRDGKYAIKPRVPLGIMPAEMLISIASIVEDYMLPSIKLTAGQRVMITGIDYEDIDPILDRIGLVGYPCPHYVQTCSGTASCLNALQDTLCIAATLEMQLLDFGKGPAKMKFGVSGCPRCCSESYLRDVGLIGRKKGWDLIFGGNAGLKPRKGDLIAKGLDMTEVSQALECLLNFYKKNAKPKERTARFVERIGIEALYQALEDCGFSRPA